jgi:hypothetical protein
MAVSKGYEGSVKVGSATVANVTEWSFSEAAEVIDITALGNSSRVKTTGLKSGSGSLTCQLDDTDSSGQGAMDAGNSTLVLKLYTDADSYVTFTAVFSEVGVSVPLDGVVQRTFTFESSGAITWTSL